MTDSETPPASHILTVAQTFAGGGVERAMLRLAGQWIAAGRRVSLLLGSGEGPLAAELPPGIHVHELGDRRYRAMAALPGLAQRIAPDVFFCPGNHYSGVAAWTRLSLGRAAPPIVCKISNALARPEMHGIGGWAYPHWLRLHPRFIDAFVAMTPGMAEETVRAMRVAPDRVHVIPNPPARRIADAAPVALPAGRFILGVGRLEPQKRWDRMIAALPRLPEDVTLVILGEGSLRDALAEQARALGLGARLWMPGHVGDPIPAMEAANLLVLTSDFEGVPGVLREAVALGTPVVATDSSVAVREIVDDPLRGTVVERDDDEGLVTAINAWLAPGRVRPTPPVETQADSAAAYLALFDALARQRAAERTHGSTG